MADLQQFAITALSAASVNVPRFRIEAQVTDSTTGAVIADFTGANAIQFPGDLAAILPTAADKREFVDLIANYLLRKKAGLT